MEKHCYLAFDLGATSYRAIVGILQNNILRMEEIARFENHPLRVGNRLYWDILGIYNNLLSVLKTVGKEKKYQIESLGIDSWGVDFGLLGRSGELIGNLYAYRDSQTDGVISKFAELIPEHEIYSRTGIQLMSINSLFQLFAMKLRGLRGLEISKALLFTPDMLNYFFTGQKFSEFTIASTSQLINATSQTWDQMLIDKLGISAGIFQTIVMPGTTIGTLREEVIEETGLPAINVVAVAAHDTASAIAAIPATGKNWAYLSSGTWSLMGIELEKPLINSKTAQMNFTNEGGVNGTYRFLKNLTGLWILEECRRKWKADGMDYSYSELLAAASEATPFAHFINVEADDFLHPRDMVEAINNFCLKTHQKTPSSIGEYVRTIFESLAFKYKETMNFLQEVRDNKIEVLHVIGGGSKNNLINQYTANALAMPVVAGPSEGTAMGNILVQALATKKVVTSVEHLRSIVRNSVETTTFNPHDTESWQLAFKKYLSVTQNF